MEQLCTLSNFSDVSPITQLLFDTLLVIQILDSVYEPIYTVKNLYNDLIILHDGFLIMNFEFCTFLRGIWYYLQVSIIDNKSPIGASLYNIGTRISSQRTTSSSSKCREDIRWRRLFIINNGYEEKNNNRKYGCN